LKGWLERGRKGVSEPEKEGGVRRGVREEKERRKAREKRGGGRWGKGGGLLAKASFGARANRERGRA
jgi:hypothetical protein